MVNLIRLNNNPTGSAPLVHQHLLEMVTQEPQQILCHLGGLPRIGILLNHPSITVVLTDKGIPTCIMRLSTGTTIMAIMGITLTHISITTMVSIHTTSLSNINRTCINNSLACQACRLVPQARMQVWYQPHLASSLKVLMRAIMANDPSGLMTLSSDQNPGAKNLNNLRDDVGELG